MTSFVEFLLPRRPLSHQSGSARHKAEWRDFVYGRAFAAWTRHPIIDGHLKLTVVYLCEQHPIDINNVIKPIGDAMNTVVYADDSLITDITGHLRYLAEPIDIIGLPELLAEAVLGGTECVYVRVSSAGKLNEEVGND